MLSDKTVDTMDKDITIACEELVKKAVNSGCNLPEVLYLIITEATFLMSMASLEKDQDNG